MKLIWTPYWYALDQSIVAGDNDIFFISSDITKFANGLLKDGDDPGEAYRVEIVAIEHPSLGPVKGILNMGFDYYVYRQNGDVIEVNAEEDPGAVVTSGYTVTNWTFEVEVTLGEAIPGYRETMMELNDDERRDRFKQKLDQYQKLLEIAALPDASYFEVNTDEND